MINIAQPNPAAWSPPVSGAAPPVAAVAAIRPLQDSARNGQSGADRQRDTPARPDRQAEAREVARLFPGDRARATGRTATEGRGVGDVLARRDTEQVARELAAEQAAEEARRTQRQALLANVWKASAAVVERVLGRDGAVVAPSAAERPAPSGRQPAEQLTLPWPVMPQDASPSLARADFPDPQDVVAYDERGNSNLAPLEIGVLISRRV